MDVQILYIPTQDQQTVNKRKGFFLRNIGIQHTIKATLLLCYLLYQEVYTLQSLHTASLVGQD